MSDKDTEERTCEPGHTATQVCKTCEYKCCDACKDSHSQATNHPDFLPLESSTECRKTREQSENKEVQERKAQLLALQKKIEDTTANAHKELSVSQSIVKAGYSLALAAIQSVRTQLDTQMNTETQLQGELISAMGKSTDYKEVLNAFSSNMERGPEESKEEIMVDVVSKYKEKIKEIESEVANTQQLIDTIHNSSYSFMSTVMQLAASAFKGVEVNLGKLRSGSRLTGGKMKNLLNLKTGMEREISAVADRQDKLGDHLKILEDKIELLKESSMKDRLCSVCKKQEECLHRLECKHKMCANCVKEIISSQVTKQRKIEVKCWKCGKNSTAIAVELSCGCSEDLMAKRAEIIEATHGEIYFYNSVTLECKRPVCRNSHMMAEEDLLLFYTPAALQQEREKIAKAKRKDELTSLRADIEKVIAEPHVDLSGKLIRDEDSRLVADLVRANTKLKVLNLNTNELRDEGLVTIAEAVRKHNGMVLLDLRGNKFTEWGKNYMEEVNKDKGKQLKIMYYYITLYLVYPHKR
eukprot:TRINITY_DN1178_c0_g3_i1.p1 TRINITY_DN1178_c0_g3~~TRINITY_DN1178_c0_g3_i1.p1  ORF type:complete len:525 (+),score=149.76 TRINITY_DN1178_c0_g3_i1:115-1689(+)